MSEKSIRKVVLFICITFLAMAMFGQSALAKENVSDKEVRTISADADFNNSMNHIYGGYLREAETLHVLAANKVYATSAHRDDTIATASLSGIPSTEHLLVAWNWSDHDSSGDWYDRYRWGDRTDTDDGDTDDTGCDDADAGGAAVVTSDELEALIERIEYLESLHFRFADLGDGTIRDNDSELIWLKAADCLGRMDWANALRAVEELGDGDCGWTAPPGQWRWMLPSEGEWSGFTSQVYEDPALVNTRGDDEWLEGDAFTGVEPDCYWSRSEDVDRDGYAMVVDMEDGIVYSLDKTASCRVWPVFFGFIIE